MRQIYILLFSIACCCFNQSCQKDRLELTTASQASSPNVAAFYDAFGAKLEQVISHAVLDKVFKQNLIEQLAEMPLGDTEILLSSFLRAADKSSASLRMMDILLEYAEGQFEEEELEQFLENFPSIIIASRGPVSSWQGGLHVPPVAFLPAGFSEQDKTIEATIEGQTAIIDVYKPFEEAVIALHLSERHDRHATPYYLTEAGNPNRLQADAKNDPSIKMGADDLGTSAALGGICVEPTACSDVYINNFSVVPQNGALFISYNLANIGGVCDTWIRVKIYRINPDGTTTTTYRHGGQLPAFYDANITPGVQYTYSMEAYVHYITGVFPNGDHIACDGDTSQSITVTSPAIASPVGNYNGENLSNTDLYYTWQSPQQGANEYQLRKWVNGNWQIVTTLPGTQTYYQYSYPSSDRNNSVYMSIRHRSSGPWSEPVFDETKGSFRNQGSDLYFHGMELPTTYELNNNDDCNDPYLCWQYESPLHGAPEYRVLASQGTSPTTVGIIQEYVTPTRRCYSTEMITHIEYDPYDGRPDEYTYNAYSNFYVPIDGSIPIIQGWNSDLHGQYVTIEVSETDVMEITATGEVITNANSKKLSTKIGLKLFGSFSLGLGYQQTTTTKETTSVLYPSSDIPIGHKIYSYNEPMSQETDGMFFGPRYFESLCCYFEELGEEVALGCN